MKYFLNAIKKTDNQRMINASLLSINCLVVVAVAIFTVRMANKESDKEHRTYSAIIFFSYEC